MPSATLLLCAIACFTIDQASKAFALAIQQSGHAPFSRSCLRCRLNTRVTRGVLRGSGVMIGLWCAEVAALVALVELVPTSGGLLAPAALGAALGGAAGNLVDRVRRGGVVDFIDLRFWPVNLADVAIVAGVLGGVTAVI